MSGEQAQLRDCQAALIRLARQLRELVPDAVDHLAQAYVLVGRELSDLAPTEPVARLGLVYLVRCSYCNTTHSALLTDSPCAEGSWVEDSTGIGWVAFVAARQAPTTYTGGSNDRAS